MTTRKILSTTLAAALLAAPFAASAATTAAKPAKPAVHHAAKPVKAGHRATARTAPRDSGSAAVDALNEQALARARGTAQ